MLLKATVDGNDSVQVSPGKRRSRAGGAGREAELPCSERVPEPDPRSVPPAGLF